MATTPPPAPAAPRSRFLRNTLLGGALLATLGAAACTAACATGVYSLYNWGKSNERARYMEAESQKGNSRFIPYDRSLSIMEIGEHDYRSLSGESTKKLMLTAGYDNDGNGNIEGNEVMRIAVLSGPEKDDMGGYINEMLTEGRTPLMRVRRPGTTSRMRSESGLYPVRYDPEMNLWLVDASVIDLKRETAQDVDPTGTVRVKKDPVLRK